MSESVSVSSWVVREAQAFDELPVGNYLAAFKGVEDVTIDLTNCPPSKYAKANDTGERCRFSWEVTTGDHKGKIATALTSRSITPSTQAGELIAGLLQRQLVAGEKVKDAIDACVGKVYMVGVKGGKQGGKPCVRECGKPPQM